MADSKDRTEADAIIEAARLGVDASIETIEHPNEDLLALVVKRATKDGVVVEVFNPALFDSYRDGPRFRRGTAKFTDLASFVAHANRFKDKDSALFAAISTEPSLTSVLDYHRAGADEDPRFGKHRGVYSFPLSEEWLAWAGQNGKSMAQVDFAAFVEDRILDIADGGAALDRAKAFAEALSCSFASPQKMLELSRGLSVRVDSAVKNAQNLATGEAQILFETKHTDEVGAPIKVPTAFLITIPVFKNGAAYQIPARLRYRVNANAGRVTWSYELYRADRVLEHAVTEACDAAVKETTLPLFRGTPEESQ